MIWVLLSQKWPWISVPQIGIDDSERVVHGQPTARLGTVKNSLGLLDWTENGPCVFQAKYCLNWMT